MTCRPGHPPRHPDFEIGNSLHLTHGARSERAIEDRAAEIRPRLLEVAPWLDRDEFMPAVARYARAEARELLAHAYIEQVTAEKGFGAVSVRLLEATSAAANTAGRLAAQLGLDPTSYARLRATLGAAATTENALAAMADRGRQFIDSRQPTEDEEPAE